MGLLELLRFSKWGKLRPKARSSLWTTMMRTRAPGVQAPSGFYIIAASLDSHIACVTAQASGKDSIPGVAPDHSRAQA